MGRDRLQQPAKIYGPPPHSQEELALEQTRRRPISDLAKAIALAAAYVACARLGLRIHAVSSFATLVWPPSGIALAALLVWGNRFWPSVAVGALLANVLTGAPPLVALGIAAGNTLEAVAGSAALRRIPGFRTALDRLPDVLGLLLLGAVGSTMIAATVGVTTLSAAGLVGAGSFGETWRAWWLGDAIGDLIVAPLLLTWIPGAWRRVRRARVFEAAALTALSVVAAIFLFDQAQGMMATLFTPLLVWAAIRFDRRGAARVTFLIAAIAVWGTVRGHGPFAREPVEAGLFSLQTFMALNAATFLVLGASICERRRSEGERRSAERAVRESEQRYRAIAEVADLLLWTTDAAGRITYVNPQFEQKFGQPFDETGASAWEERLHPADRVATLDARALGRDAGKPYRMEYRMRTRDGSYRWMLARVVPVHDAGGEVVSWFGASADIEDLKLAEAQLRRAKEDAESANRAKDRFLAALSHELRTPLTPVLAFSSALEGDADLTAEAKRRVEIVRRNAELEARLIDDLLDLTRIASGKLRVQVRPVRLADAVEHVREICLPEATAKGVALEVASDAPDACVHADPARLRQVLWNLVQNAIKFTPAGGRIGLRTLPTSDGRVAVEVEDTGAGIASDDLPRIFRPFEQADSAAGGLGLGLAISAALVEAHAGALTASSAGRGSGATFRMELPLSDEAPARADAEPGTARVTEERKRSRRVLVVEDHADTLTAAKALLSELSCDVVAVPSLREALAAAESQPFDLVLSDLGLPDGSGLELMRLLRERHGLSGIAVTGYGMEDDVRRSREAGFVDHLVKPITFQRLARAVEGFFASAPTAPPDGAESRPPG
jgi:PAS domain S-box-containing protein